ncbi:MAG TPA: GGDEF domain-containing protein [Actinomycetota bacterium]|nr:GGDEF domain-containing protein [Actinomycetota bacterium]
MTGRSHRSAGNSESAPGSDAAARADPWWTAYEATRSILHATTVPDVVDAVSRFVRKCEGRVVPGDEAPPGALPLDVSLGGRSPLLAVAEGATARRHLARFLPRVVEDARLAAGRIRHEERLATDATVDPLTGVLNRRGLARVVPRLSDGDAVVALDVDELDGVNQMHGTEGGDAVLTGFAQMIAEQARLDDRCGRTGGDEFVLTMRRTSVDGALALVRRMLARWQQIAPHPVTFSAGIANVDEGPPARALVRADRALSRAKQSGGNAVEVILSVDDADLPDR